MGWVKVENVLDVPYQNYILKCSLNSGSWVRNNLKYREHILGEVSREEVEM